MVEPLDEAGNEEDGGEAAPGSGARPPIEPVLAAFRQAARRRGHPAGRSGPDAPGPEESDPPSRPESEGERAPSEPEVPRAPTEIIEATIAAFRTVKCSGTTSRTETSPTERPEPERSREEPSPQEEPTPEQTPSLERKPPEQKEPEQEEPEDLPSPEELAPAFRKALSERSRPSKGAEPAGPEEEPPERETLGQEALPARPDDSFFWVTAQPDEQRPEADPSRGGRPGDRLASVPVGRLSGPRAVEAEAFLLRGEGERPYRLLRRIRGHPDASVYLKPVFWDRPRGAESPVAIHVDGEWTEEGREVFEKLRETAGAINRRIREVDGAGEHEAGGVELRVLRFVATRNQEFLPRRMEGDEDKLVYPKLTPLLNRESPNREGELAQILSKTARRIQRRQ